MEQDTDSQKPRRWFRQTTKHQSLAELEHLFDLYWGGPERRITSLTIKIISVNVIALIILSFGILYLGEYQKNIIETKLKSFEREANIVGLAISAFDLENPNHKAKIKKIIDGHRQEIKIFDKNGIIILQEKSHYRSIDNGLHLNSVQILKDTASLIFNLIPDITHIPLYPNAEPQNIPDLQEALSGVTSFSAWEDHNEEILLSAGVPLLKNNQSDGAIVIIRQAEDIKNSISKVWQDIVGIFIGTLIVTLILSIYLAGTIAKPLKKLARVAEDVRTGKATGDDIPDFSNRHDEIGDLSVVLRSMTDALWAKMDSIESFAADVAHELKNPLTSLSSAIETLQKVKKQEDREKLMGIIAHDIKRLDRLITDISSASRLDAALSRTDFTPISIAQLATDLLETYKDPIERDTFQEEEKGNNKVKTKDNKFVELHFNSNKKYMIQGSDERIKQVLANLIDNALSFSQEQDTVKVTMNRGENLVAIHVDDEGPGIPEKKIKTIFDRFYTERPEESYGEHSGLGLSISKQIIESHRGEIFAENRHDMDGQRQGARFSIILKAYNDA